MGKQHLSRDDRIFMRGKLRNTGECLRIMPAAADLIENQQREIEALKSALHEMAVDFVAMGRIDYWFCDDVPTELHMKHQPKNDGNYENEPCTECVKEYYLQKASGEIDARSRADEG